MLCKVCAGRKGPGRFRSARRGRLVSTGVEHVRWYVVRHGRSEFNEDRRISGQSDASLADEGREQAEALAEVLRGEKLDAVYSSPLERAVETAAPVAAAQGLAIRLEPDLKEISMGVLEGRKRDESDPEALRIWEEWQRNKFDYRGHGGETFRDLEARVSRCLRSIAARHRDQTVLIAGHRSTNRVILSALMNWSLERSLELKIHSRYLYRVEAGRIETIRLDRGKAGRRYEGYHD